MKPKEIYDKYLEKIDHEFRTDDMVEEDYKEQLEVIEFVSNFNVKYKQFSKAMLKLIKETPRSNTLGKTEVEELKIKYNINLKELDNTQI